MEMSVLRKVMERVWESGLVASEGFQLLWHAGEPLAVPVSWYEKAFEVINGFPGASQRILHARFLLCLLCYFTRPCRGSDHILNSCDQRLRVLCLHQCGCASVLNVILYPARAGYE